VEAYTRKRETAALPTGTSILSIIEHKRQYITRRVVLQILRERSAALHYSTIHQCVMIEEILALTQSEQGESSIETTPKDSRAASDPVPRRRTA
jgi:hypothetical protein